MRRPAFPWLLAGVLSAAGVPSFPPGTPPDRHAGHETAPPGSAWSARAREDVEEATRRHVRLLERVADRMPVPDRPEVSRVRDMAAMARESAARAFVSPSRNEMVQARAEVRDAFRTSRIALHRLSAGIAPRDARELRAALDRIAVQQARALRGFDRALGFHATDPASNSVPRR